MVQVRIQYEIKEKKANLLKEITRSTKLYVIWNTVPCYAVSESSNSFDSSFQLLIW